MFNKDKVFVFDTNKFWVYDYKIEYYDSDFHEDYNYKGIVIAESVEDAIARLKYYYFDDNCEIQAIHIEARVDGEVYPSMVYEEVE